MSLAMDLKTHQMLQSAPSIKLFLFMSFDSVNLAHYSDYCG